MSLTGACHPIGGLNEKALAALQAGVKTLRLPAGNQKDVNELPAPAKKGLKIFTHKHIDEIIMVLFVEGKGGSGVTKENAPLKDRSTKKVKK